MKVKYGRSFERENKGCIKNTSVFYFEILLPFYGNGIKNSSTAIASRIHKQI